MTSHRIRVVLFALGLLATACGSGADGTTPTDLEPAALPLGTWTLTDGELDGTVIPVTDTHPITLVVEASTVGGTSACNSYGGGLSMSPAGGFEAGDLMQTKMACDPPEVMLAERAYTEALGRVDTWARDADRLLLTGPSVELRFSPTPPAGADGLVGTAWVLVDGALDGSAVPRPATHPITLTVDATRVGGTAACNGYGAEVTITPEGSFETGDLGATAMACEPPEVMLAERVYLEALGRVDSWDLAGDDLLLTGPSVELRFEPIPPVDTAALQGTIWLLESIVERDTVGTTEGDAWVEFAEDGTMTGWTGCRSLTGVFIEQAGEILLTELAADGVCPDILSRQDSMVVEVLGDGFGVEIVEDVLTATSGTLGLVFRAEA